MAKNTDRNDDFWTLSELVPKRTYIKKPESDISPVTVETGDEEGAGAPVPTVGKRPSPPARESVSYSPEHSLIKEVTLEPWPANFSFYSKFHSEAVKLFSVEGKHCPPERFLRIPLNMISFRKASLTFICISGNSSAVESTLRLTAVIYFSCFMR